MMHRRDFLALVAAASLSGATSASPQRRWQLAIEPGLFECDALPRVTDQIAFAAAQGFRAFVDDAWLSRSEQERQDILQATRTWGLRWGPLRGPAFRSCARHEWQRDVQAALGEAARVGATGVRIDAEPTACAAAWLRLPGLLVEWSSCDDPAALAEFSEVRFSVDFYWLAARGVNIVAFLERHVSRIGHIELADFPGGLEPGTGGLPIHRLCGLLDAHGYTGVVGLRHGRSRPGWLGIAAVLEACGRMEPSLRWSAAVV